MSDVSEPLTPLFGSLVVSCAAFVGTKWLVPRVGPHFVQKGLRGTDMLKGYSRADNGSLGGPALPESMGVIAAGVYILLLCFFAPIPYLPHLSERDGYSSIDFPHHSLATYLAALMSLLVATFLGFLDDVFDIRWRYKMPIPIIASVPLLVVYFAGRGATDIVVPNILGLRDLLNVSDVRGVYRLGALYYVYMALLSTFCTHSINILAGVNGVEVGQSLIIALSLVLNDTLYLSLRWGDQAFGFNLARGSATLIDRHLFSLYFILPLVGVCLGLLSHNWYPASVFVGDTFCYFAGMAFAVVGILGHYSKTLALFFLPQAINFILSCPQLFGLVPCPRHRLPRYEPKSGMLYPSQALFTAPPPLRSVLVLRSLAALRLVRLTYSSDGRYIVATTNLTLINAFLVIFGPMKEENLCRTVLTAQCAGSAVAFAIRYGLAGVFYGPERR